MITNIAKKLDYDNYLISDEWKEKRQQAFKYYGHKCTKCGSETNLHIHHNTYKHFKNETMKELNVLCMKCHFELHDRIKLKTGKRKLKKLNNHKNKASKLAPVKETCKTCIEYLNSFSPCRIGKSPSTISVCESYCSKKEHFKTKNTKGNKNKNKSNGKSKKVKTMAEIVLSLEQQQKNAEIRRLKKAKKESNGQVHIGIGTPSQRQYKKPTDQPLQVLDKPKNNKPPKPKKPKINTEHIKAKTWLDVIQEEFDMKTRACK